MAIKERYGEVRVLNVSLTGKQFEDLCSDETGLGLYNFCCQLENMWESYSYKLDCLKRVKESVQKDCERWLKLNGLPLNSVIYRILQYD